MKRFVLWASFFSLLSIGVSLFAGIKSATMQVTAIVPASTQIALAPPIFAPVSLAGGVSAFSNISICSPGSSNYAIRVEGGTLLNGDAPNLSFLGNQYHSSPGESRIFQVFAKKNGDQVLTITVEY